MGEHARAEERSTPISPARVPVAHLTTIDLTLRFLLLQQLEGLRHRGFDVAGISAEGPWASDLTDLGIRHVRWTRATRSWAPVRDVLALAELVRILRKGGFALVHTHNPKPGILGRFAARLAGVPCVINTVHGFYASPEDPPRRKLPVIAAEWIAARMSDLELYQSEEDLRWSLRLRIATPHSAVLLGNGTDLTRFNPAAVSAEEQAEVRSELGIPSGALVVGTVGRLVAEKGYEDLKAAAELVRQQVPKVRFIAVGGNDPDKADAVAPNELERSGILVTGWREDVEKLLAAMDIFVLASRREGLPRSAIEAAAMAKPLILTDIRGCREVARDGSEGILVPIKDPRRLADGILALVHDEGLRRKLGEAARKRAEERFNERRVVETVVQETERLLLRKGLLHRNVGGVPIRKARRDDADVMAQLHSRALPEAFLPQLGHGFMSQLYRALIKDRDAETVVVEEGGDVVGFAAGVLSVSSFYKRFLIRHGFLAILRALPRLFRRGLLKRAIETANYSGDVEERSDAELLAIAVADTHSGRGIGRALARGVLEGLCEKEAERIRVVVAARNEAANHFYERIGFTFERQMMLHEGTTSNVLSISCHSSSLSQ